MKIYVITCHICNGEVGIIKSDTDINGKTAPHQRPRDLTNRNIWDPVSCEGGGVDMTEWLRERSRVL